MTMDAKTKEDLEKYLSGSTEKRIDTLLNKDLLGDDAEDVAKRIASDLFSTLGSTFNNTFIVDSNILDALSSVQDKLLLKKTGFAKRVQELKGEKSDLEVELGIIHDKIVVLEGDAVKKGLIRELEEKWTTEKSKTPKNRDAIDKAFKALNAKKDELKALIKEQTDKTKKLTKIEDIVLLDADKLPENTKKLWETYQDIANKAKLSFAHDTVNITKSATDYTLLDPATNAGVTLTRELYVGNHKLDNSGSAFDVMIGSKKYTVEKLTFNSTTKKLKTNDMIITDADGHQVTEALDLPIMYVASFDADIADKVHADTKTMKFSAHQKIVVQLGAERLTATKQSDEVLKKAPVDTKIDTIVATIEFRKDERMKNAIAEIVASVLPTADAARKQELVDQLFADPTVNTAGLSYASFAADMKSDTSPLIKSSFVGNEAKYRQEILDDESNWQAAFEKAYVAHIRRQIESDTVRYNAVKDMLVKVGVKLPATTRATELSSLSTTLDPIATAVDGQKDRVIREILKGIVQTEIGSLGIDVDQFIDGLLTATPPSIALGYASLVADFKGVNSPLIDQFPNDETEAAYKAHIQGMTTADLTTHAKNLLQTNIEHEVKTTHWAALHTAIDAVRTSSGILSAATQSTVLTAQKAKIDPMADLVYTSYPITLDKILDDLIAARAGAGVPDAQKAHLRNALRAHLATTAFSYDATAFRTAAVSDRSALINKTYKGTAAQLANDIQHNWKQNDILNNLRPFLQQELEGQINDVTAAWNTGATTLNTLIVDAINSANTANTPLSLADQDTVVHNPANNFLPRVNNMNLLTFRNQGEYNKAVTEMLTAVINEQGGNVLTNEQRERLIAQLLPLAINPTGGALLYTEARFQSEFLDSNPAIGSPLYDAKFTGDQAAFRDRVQNLITSATTPNIASLGKEFLRKRVRASLDAHMLTLIPSTGVTLQDTIQDSINGAIGGFVDTAHNLMTTTTGPLAATLLTTYAYNRGMFFPMQDEARRRYRGLPIVRNMRRAFDHTFRGGHKIQNEVVTRIQQNSYMTFFERLDNTASPEKISNVALPMAMGNVDISVGMKYHPFQNSLSQNGTVIVNVAGQQVNVGPVERISHGFGIHGMIEAVLRHRFHADESVNNVITANIVIGMYKSLIKEAIGKVGELRHGNERISLNNNGNIVFEDPVTGGFDEQQLRDSNNYADAFTRISQLARGFNSIMTHKNHDYTDGVLHRQRNNPRHARLGRSLNPVYRYRNRNLLRNNVEFQCDGIQGSYDRRGRMTLKVQSPDGEEIQLPPRGKVKKFTDAVKRTDLEDIFASPLVYGRQHEILRAFYKSYLERLFKNRRVARHGYWFQHDGHRYAIVNRGTPENQQLSFCEVEAGMPIPGGGTAGVLNQSIVNALQPINENVMLSNPALMNQFIDTITRHA